MKKFIIVLISILAIVGIVLGYIFLSKDEKITENTKLNIELGEKFNLIEKLNNKYILDYQKQDIDKDNEKEDIVLIGDKEMQSDVFSKNIYLIIRNTKNNKLLEYEIKNLEGYENRIKFATILDYNIPNIIISSSKGGEKNIKQYVILKYENDKIKEIFTLENNSGINVSGKYLDGFKAEINIIDANKKVQIEIKDKEEYYLKKKQYDENGICLNKTKEIKSSPLSLLIVEKLEDNSNIIKTKQMIFGIDNTDIIDVMEVSWKFYKDKFEIFEIQSQRIGKIL